MTLYLICDITYLINIIDFYLILLEMMMNKMKKRSTLLTIIELILCVLCLVGGSISAIKLHNTLLTLCVNATILGVLFAIFYILYGHSKNAAVYFKIFLLLLTIAELTRIVAVGGLVFDSVTDECLSIFICCVTFACYIILTCVKDLGKVKSLCICGLVLVIKLFFLISLIVREKNFIGTSANNSLEVLLIPSVQCLVTILLSLLMIEKYIDKEARGTK